MSFPVRVDISVDKYSCCAGEICLRARPLRCTDIRYSAWLGSAKSPCLALGQWRSSPWVEPKRYDIDSLMYLESNRKAWPASRNRGSTPYFHFGLVCGVVWARFLLLSCLYIGCMNVYMCTQMHICVWGLPRSSSNRCRLEAETRSTHSLQRPHFHEYI